MIYEEREPVSVGGSSRGGGDSSSFNDGIDCAAAGTKMNKKVVLVTLSISVT